MRYGNGFSRRGFLGSVAALGAASLTGCASSPNQSAGQASLPPRGEWVVRGAYVLSMDPAIGDLPRGDVHVRNGEIVAVGPNLAAPGAQVLDGRNMIVMPGFVDTHWHMWTTSLRAIIRNDDASKVGYFPVSARLGNYFTPDDMYRSVRLGAAEALQSGVTTLHDWAHNMRSPEHADANLRALDGAGIRARFSYGYSGLLQPGDVMNLADLARVQNEWIAPQRGGLLTLGMSSRGSTFQVNEDPVVWRTMHTEWDGVRKLGLPITLHVGAAGAVTALEREKLLGPDVMLVHPTRLSPAELRILADRRTVFSSSPVTETRRTGDGGDIQVAEMLAAGVPVCLSVDHVAGLNCDFFNQMRVLHWQHSHRIGDRVPLTTRRIVELATIDGAKGLGIADKVGSLTPGKRADLILVRTTDVNIAPVVDVTHALVFTAQPGNVDTAMVDGRILLRGGKLTAVDTEQVTREAAESAAGIQKRAGWPS
jgi:cytosine/adenosine deaminase-related metal-dependent hydrolase